MKFTNGERRLRIAWKRVLVLLSIGVALVLGLGAVGYSLGRSGTKTNPATVYLRNGVVIQCDDAEFYAGNLFRCDGVDYTRHTIDRVVWTNP